MINPNIQVCRTGIIKRDEVIKIEKTLYFAYGSNMNRNQMAFRCPDAEPIQTVRLEGYRLEFCANGGGNGVATVLPDPDSHVDGVLWRISDRDENHLNHYEGYPYLYGKEILTVTDQNGNRLKVMAYTMNRPYRDSPALPSRTYLEGILNGCRQNGIPTRPILETVQRIQNQLPHEEKAYDKGFRRKNAREPEWR